MNRKKKKLFTFFKIVFTILGFVLFAFLIYKTDLQTIIKNIRTIGYNFIFLLLIATLWHLCNSAAWYLLIQKSGLKTGFFKVFFNKWAAESLNAVLPMGNMGGEAFRVIMLSNNLKKEASLSNVVHDRLLHYVGSFIFICGGSIYGIVALETISFQIKTFLLFFLSILFILFFLAKYFLKKGLTNFKIKSIQKYLDAISSDLFDYENKTEIIVILLNIIGRLLGAFEIYLVLRFLGTPFPFSTALLCSSFLLLINVVFFIVPGGIGVLEGGQVAFVSWLGLSPALGMSLAITRRIRQLLMSALGILFVPFLPELSKKNIELNLKPKHTPQK